jgi:hypothetical protein
MISRRRTVTVREASRRRLGKEAGRESFEEGGIQRGWRIWRSGFLGQRGGGCRERDQRRRGEFERGEGGEKVRSFGERRLRSLEESELLNFSSAASVTGRWPTL